MEDIEKVKNDGKNGIDVSEALISLVFGGYDHDVQRKSWENLGPERILPGYKGSGMEEVQNGGSNGYPTNLSSDSSRRKEAPATTEHFKSQQ